MLCTLIPLFSRTFLWFKSYTCHLVNVKITMMYVLQTVKLIVFSIFSGSVWVITGNDIFTLSRDLQHIAHVYPRTSCLFKKSFLYVHVQYRTVHYSGL
jgi:hypothetical protein